MRSTLALVLFTALVACGDDTNKLADAPPGGHDTGSAVDSFVSGTPVQVTVTTDGSATEGVEVYFLNADSSVVKTAKTDATGVASAVMADGGSVTVLEPVTAGNPDFIDTWEGVKAGDKLVDALSSGDATGSAATITINLTVPTDAGSAVASYEIDSTCGGFQDITPGSGSGSGSAQVRRVSRVIKAGGATNPPQPVTLPATCTATDLVIATRDANGVLLDSIFVAGQAVADNANVTIPGPYVVPTTDSFTYTNLGSADDDTDTAITKNVFTANGLLDQEFGTVTPEGGSGSATVLFPVVTATEQLVESEFDSASPFEGQTAYEWGSASATYTFDGANFLPHFTVDPAFAVGSNSIAWTQAAGGKTVDGIFAGAAFERTTGAALPDGGIPVHDWDWSVIAPGTEAGNVTFPTLPTDVFDYKATGSDAIEGIAAETYSIPGGYDTFRPIGFENDDEIGFGQLAGSASGIVVIANASFADQNNGGDARRAGLHVPHKRAVTHGPAKATRHHRLRRSK